MDDAERNESNGSSTPQEESFDEFQQESNHEYGTKVNSEDISDLVSC